MRCRRSSLCWKVIGSATAALGGKAVVTGHNTHRKAGEGVATGGPSVRRSSAFREDMQRLLSICVPEVSLSGTDGGRALLLASPQPRGRGYCSDSGTVLTTRAASVAAGGEPKKVRV